MRRIEAEGVRPGSDPEPNGLFQERPAGKKKERMHAQVVGSPYSRSEF